MPPKDDDQKRKRGRPKVVPITSASSLKGPASLPGSTLEDFSPSPLSSPLLTDPVDGAGVLLPAQKEAMSLYLEIHRPAAPSPERALQEVFLSLERKRLDDGGPPVEIATLRRWSELGRWETRYLSYLSKQLINADPDLQPEARLHQLRESVRRARDIKEKAEQVLIIAGTGAPNAKVAPTSADYLNYRTAYQVFKDMSEELTELEERLQRRHLENPTANQRWIDSTEEIYEKLLAQYRGMGEHYQMLCRRLAEAHTRLTQIYESGRDITTDEYVKLQKSQLDLINQLQRYTEATKSETISKEVNNAIMLVLQLVEGIVEPNYPVLWKTIMNEVHKRVERGSLAS